jgi:DHA2 family multidrug resistance protein-like MFS transporter
MSPVNPQTTAGRREWLALAVLALPCMLVVMDLTVLFLAVPSLTADMDPSATELLWITDAYGFLIAGALVLMGALGDRVGRRRVLLTGAVAFGAASLFAALSTSPEMLIVARAAQGLAGATLVPSVMAITFALFQDEKQRTMALGVLMSCFAAGAALGPLLGGVILGAFDWHVVFLLNLPVMALLLVAGPRLLPEFRNPDAGRVDVFSAVLSVVGMLLAVYGIKELAHHGVDALPVASLAAGLAVGWAFVHRQGTLADPLLDLSLFRGTSFRTALGANVAGAFVMYGISFFLAQFMQLGLGLSPFEAGLWNLPGIAAMMIVATLIPRLVGRFTPGTLVAAGLGLCGTGFLILLTLDASSGVAPIVIATTISSIGIAPAATLGSSLIIGAAPPERSGAASGIAETGTELGGALGIALLGSLGTALYRADASEGFSSGAFVDSIHAVAIVCAVVMLGTAVAAFRYLRGTSAEARAVEAVPAPA